jgi:RNA-directed DNA polymerase
MRTDEAQARESGAMTQEPGRNLGVGIHGAEAGTAATGQTKVEEPSLMDAVVERSNLWAAYRRVVRPAGGSIRGLAEDALAKREGGAAGRTVHA